jgi:hypothetical protein
LAGKFNKEISFVTNAQDGRNYSGLMIGAAERNGHHYAAQVMYDGHVILHDILEKTIWRFSPAFSSAISKSGIVSTTLN